MPSCAPYVSPALKLSMHVHNQVGEAWSKAAMQAKEEGLSAPKVAQTELAAIQFFENMFSMKVRTVS